MGDVNPMAGVFEVRLTVDRLRHSILSAIPAHEKVMRASMERAVDEAVKSFDFDTEVKRQAHAELAKQVKQAIDHAIYTAMQSPEVKKAIADSVAHHVKVQLG